MRRLCVADVLCGPVDVRNMFTLKAMFPLKTFFLLLEKKEKSKRFFSCIAKQSKIIFMYSFYRSNKFACRHIKILNLRHF